MRSHFTLIYTESASYAQARTIQQMIEAKRLTDVSAETAEALEVLQENMPTVEQYRITVSTVNGLQQAKYRSFWRDAIDYFTRETGLPIPLPTETNDKGEDVQITLDEYQDAVLTVALRAAAALGALTRYEVRTATPIATSNGVKFESNDEWIEQKLPADIATVAGWIENCPASLQAAWAEKAYDANPGLWRQSNDEAAKNFDAVNVN